MTMASFLNRNKNQGQDPKPRKKFWQKARQPEEPHPDEVWEGPLAYRIIRQIGVILWSLIKVAIGAVGAAAAVCVIAGIVFGATLCDYLQNDVLPESMMDLDSFTLDQTSNMYYTDKDTGEVVHLQKIYTNVDRTWADYEEIPTDLIHAAVAIEDKRFFDHQGVDWFTTMKACVEMFIGTGDAGGSTITQQLIKNLTGKNEVTVRRKIEEIFSALQFERSYTKEEIMEWYLNTIYLGEGCYGVKSAARVYFGKDLDELTAAECASLISITNNPSLYDPYISLERNRKRQGYVLGEMHAQGYLTDAEYDEAIAQADNMVFTNGSTDEENYTCPNESCGVTGGRDWFYYSESEGEYRCPVCGAYVDIPEIEEDYYSYFEDTVIRDVIAGLMEEYGYTYEVADQMVKTGGYHIYTTFDPEVQAAVDEVYEDLSNFQTTDNNIQQLQSAIVIIDNTTGDIVAMAGGVGEKTGYLSWNRATQSKLQTGSSMKPLSVYGPALELGIINPATVINDAPVNFDNGRGYPLNYDRTYSGYATLTRGIDKSMNTTAVRTLEMIGLEYSFEFLTEKFHLSTLVEYEEINGREYTDIGTSPLAMGALTYGATVRDMASAYGVFSNDGVWREGRTYTKVYDSEGNLILDNTQETEQVLGEDANLYMNYLLKHAVDYGTGSTGKVSGISTAGKTGTTSSDLDRWFCGYTGYYTAAVWCGFDTPDTIKASSNPAARAFQKIMNNLHEGLPDIALYDSSKLRAVSICLDSGAIATDACQADPRGNRVVTCYVLAKDVPDEKCERHVLVSWCEEGGGYTNAHCPTSTKIGQVAYTEEELTLFERSKISIPDACIYDPENEGRYCTKHKSIIEELFPGAG